MAEKRCRWCKRLLPDDPEDVRVHESYCIRMMEQKERKGL